MTENSDDEHQAVLGPDDFEDDREIIQEFVNDALEHLAEAEGRLLVLDGDPTHAEALAGLFRGFHTIKGLAGFLGFGGIEALAHSAEDLLSDARNNDAPLPPGAADLIFESVDHLSRAVGEIKEALATEAEMPRPTSLAPELVGRIRHLRAHGSLPADNADTMHDGGAHADGAPPPATDSAPPEAVEAEYEPVEESRGGGNRSRQESIRVDADRLDRLVDAIGELVICESMFRRAALMAQPAAKNSAFGRHLDRMDKITRDLQETAGSLRMVPLRATFRKMARLARDVAHKSGKRVHFQVEGEDTELDKSIVDRVADPLVHMVRNAIDHGLESDGESRKAVGKDSIGRVVLRAFHSGGSIRIEVEDDGRGLHTERIRAKALERGLIGESDVLSERQTLQLLCAPGFSTAPKVTSISGRGVGMDVVKQHVEAMSGTLDIRTKPGEGTCFAISLPLTLAVIDGMVVRLAGHRYVVPTLNIVRLVLPEAGDRHLAFDEGEVLRIDGHLIPVLSLAEALNVEHARRDCQVAVVVEAEGVRVAIPADELLGQQQLVIKSFGDGLGDLPGIAGCTIMSDGLVGLVLDTAALIRNAQHHGQTGIDLANVDEDAA